MFVGFRTANASVEEKEKGLKKKIAGESESVSQLVAIFLYIQIVYLFLRCKVCVFKR